MNGDEGRVGEDPTAERTGENTAENTAENAAERTTDAGGRPARGSRQPGRLRPSRRTTLVIAGIAVAAAVYGTADALDEVPGVLTTRPAPAEPLPFPSPSPTPVGVARPAGLDPDAPVPTQVPSLVAALAADPRVAAQTPGLPADAGRPPAGDVAPGLAAQQSVPAGSAPAVLVLDALTGQVLGEHDPGTPRVPASTTKLVTATATLATLPPQTRVPTLVRLEGTTLTLVAGGDILLNPDAGDPTQVVGHAGLGDLARATARRLAERGTGPVTVRLDDTALPPEDLAPGLDADAARWTMPSAGIAVLAGETDAGRSADPALEALRTFASALAEAGVDVEGEPARLDAADPSHAVAGAGTEIARVESAPIGDLVTFVLKTSDNSLAEALGRQVAVARQAPTDRASVVAQVLEVVEDLGVDTTGASLADVSGLSPLSRLTATTLAQTVRLSARDVTAEAGGANSILGEPPSQVGERLSGVPLGLPVGALDGTLDDRMPEAPGVARAKTGTLGAVASLAGQVHDADGRLLVYVVVADGLPLGGVAPARGAIDDFVASLAACGCR